MRTQAQKYHNINLITILNDWQVGSIYSMGRLDEGMSHVPGKAEWDGARLHHGTHNDMKFKLMNYFWNFLLNIFRPQLTKTMESETMDEGQLLYLAHGGHSVNVNIKFPVNCEFPKGKW